MDLPFGTPARLALARGLALSVVGVVGVVGVVSVVAAATGEPGRAAADEAQAKEVKELYELSGTPTLLAAMANQAGRAVRERLAGSDQLPAAERVVAEAFAPAHLEPEVLTRLEAAYDAKQAAAALAWWRQPLARRLVKLAQEATESEARSALRAFAQKREKQPPSAERQRLLDRLEADLRLTEASLARSQAVALAAEVAANQLAPQDRRRDLDALRKQAAERVHRQRAERRQLTMLLVEFSYRDLSDAGLGKYVEFAESDAGRWYVASMHKAVEGALDSAAVGVGPALAAELAKGGG